MNLTIKANSTRVLLFSKKVEIMAGSQGGPAGIVNKSSTIHEGTGGGCIFRQVIVRETLATSSSAGRIVTAVCKMLNLGSTKKILDKQQLLLPQSQ